jgi:nucleobase:cation symporter-1, NCS1 family
MLAETLHPQETIVASEKPGSVEQHTIYQIPHDQRHGTFRDLFTVWFGSNIMMLTIVTGALATTVFKLDFLSSILAIALGNFVGAICMALHAAQGPQLGVPQMVQTRGQFGSMGAVLVVGIVIIMYVGFLASNIVLGGQSLHTIAPGISDHALLVLIAVVSVIATIFGHDLIHAYARILTYVSGSALLLTFAWMVFVHGLPAGMMHMTPSRWPGSSRWSRWARSGRSPMPLMSPTIRATCRAIPASRRPSGRLIWAALWVPSCR